MLVFASNIAYWSTDRQWYESMSEWNAELKQSPMISLHVVHAKNAPENSTRSGAAKNKFGVTSTRVQDTFGKYDVATIGGIPQIYMVP